MIDPVEVYFADGPLQGKFMYVNTWPVRAMQPHEFSVRTFCEYESTELIQFAEVIYSHFFTVDDTDGNPLRIAHLSSDRPTIKSLLIRD